MKDKKCVFCGRIIEGNTIIPICPVCLETAKFFIISLITVVVGGKGMHDKKKNKD